MDRKTARKKVSGRVRGKAPVKPPEGTVLVTRDEAAELAGVSVRTVTRWADEGWLTKYRSQSSSQFPQGRVMFSRDQARSLRKAQEPQPPVRPPRW